jgi:two-component system, NtrC family, sensor kinase
MKLAAKLILLFLVGVLGIVSLFSWQILQRQSEWDEQLRETHAKNLVETLDPAITTAYRDGGVVTVQQVVEISTQKLTGPHMRWIDGKERSMLEKQTLTHRVSTVFVAPTDENPIDYSYVPLVVDGKDAGAIEVAIPMEPQAAYVRASLYGSILSLLGVAILSASVIFLGGIHWVGKPLKKLVEQVNTIGQGNFPQPAVLSSSDELGRLAKAISQMSYRLSEQRDTIRHTDRIGTIGTLAAGVAHELGTPLNVVSGRAGLIATGKLSDAEIEASAKTIKSEADRMTVIIRQLLDFARQTPSSHSLIKTREIVLSTCDIMRPMAKNANVELITEIPEDPFSIAGDAAQIQQVLTNLIRNAIQAMPDGGVLTVEMLRAETGKVCIQITDTGVGMKSEDIDRAFEPFFTTKDVGMGTGLGLSIAYGIVSEHGGEIKIKSRLGAGTTFSVLFPPAKPSAIDPNKASV